MKLSIICKVNGCIWYYSDIGLQPILVCEPAKEIYDHLMYYSDNGNSDSFEFYFEDRKNEYKIGLKPSHNSLSEEIIVFLSQLIVTCYTSDHSILFSNQLKKNKSVTIRLLDYQDSSKYSRFADIPQDLLYTLKIHYAN